MKLYYAPGACSLSPHIVIREADIPCEIERVDLRTKKTEDGADYLKENPKGQVPLLVLDDGDSLSEGPAVVQYLADQKPATRLAPAAGTRERYHLMEWLNFTTSELHKSFGALFTDSTPDDAKKLVREGLQKKLAYLDGTLARSPYILGDDFTVADAYLFTVLNWTRTLKVDTSRYPNVEAYLARVGARPKVRQAMQEEGLIR